jgi:hypothetical protein
MYARVTKLYFGGMAKHLSELRKVLRPGARLAYVVGDQASYLRVMIRTGKILADIAQTLGYEVMGIDLFRTRLATATKEQLREEVVLLRWRGKDAAQASCPTASWHGRFQNRIATALDGNARYDHSAPKASNKQVAFSPFTGTVAVQDKGLQ